MELTVLSWNLFHGRDFPPDPSLFTWRSRLLGTSERGATHVQVNRELLEEFAAVLAGARWDVALLQECPPRWWAPLAAACGAEPHGVLTSRNSLGALRAHLARQNPDLLAAAEGGSNLTLVRPRPSLGRSAVPYVPSANIRNSGTSEGRIVGRREVEIHRGRPERRAMALTRVGGGDGALCVANLHATNDRPEMAAEDVLRAAAAAVELAARVGVRKADGMTGGVGGDEASGVEDEGKMTGAALIFGGDLNLRPAESPGVFEELRERFGLDGTTGPEAIDHILTRGLETVVPPRPWPPEARELREDGLALRLSDHAPVEGRFAAGGCP